MKLFTTRHGESKANIDKIVQGQSFDSELSEVGLEQADKVAERLKDEPIGFVYASSATRARQTAEAILKYHPDAEIVYDDRLQERSFGKYEGQPSAEMHKDVAESGEEYSLFKPKGGESWYEAGERFRQFYEENILARHQNSDETVLIVGHGTVLMNFLLWLDKKLDESADHKHHYDAYHPSNTAVSVITIDDEGNHQIITLNDKSHLEKEI